MVVGVIGGRRAGWDVGDGGGCAVDIGVGVGCGVDMLWWRWLWAEEVLCLRCNEQHGGIE